MHTHTVNIMSNKMEVVVLILGIFDTNLLHTTSKAHVKNEVSKEARQTSGDQLPVNELKTITHNANKGNLTCFVHLTL